MLLLEVGITTCDQITKISCSPRLKRSNINLYTTWIDLKSDVHDQKKVIYTMLTLKVKLKIVTTNSKFEGLKMIFLGRTQWGFRAKLYILFHLHAKK